MTKRVARMCLLAARLASTAFCAVNPPGVVENSFHVVTGSGTDATSTLYGFTITGGNADGS